MRDLLRNEKESEMTIVTTLGKGAKTAAHKDMKKDKKLSKLSNYTVGENEVIETYFRDGDDYSTDVDVLVEYDDMDDISEWYMD
jgi:predicted nucleotidyltransferase